jgi:hypothetical protein
VGALKAKISILGYEREPVALSPLMPQESLGPLPLRQARYYSLCLSWDGRCLRTYAGPSPAFTKHIGDARNQTS